jgi:hypothetical protein
LPELRDSMVRIELRLARSRRGVIGERQRAFSLR